MVELPDDAGEFPTAQDWDWLAGPVAFLLTMAIVLPVLWGIAWLTR